MGRPTVNAPYHSMQIEGCAKSEDSKLVIDILLRLHALLNERFIWFNVCCSIFTLFPDFPARRIRQYNPCVVVYLHPICTVLLVHYLFKSYSNTDAVIIRFPETDGHRAEARKLASPLLST